MNPFLDVYVPLWFDLTFYMHAFLLLCCISAVASAFILLP